MRDQQHYQQQQNQLNNINDNNTTDFEDAELNSTTNSITTPRRGTSTTRINHQNGTTSKSAALQTPQTPFSPFNRQRTPNLNSTRYPTATPGFNPNVTILGQNVMMVDDYTNEVTAHYGVTNEKTQRQLYFEQLEALETQWVIEDLANQ
jgi:hypothetical protein